MSADGQIGALLAALDGPAAPRPEFGGMLLARLLEELRAPSLGKAHVARRSRSTWSFQGRRRGWRIAVAGVLLLLLLAGIATATYLGVRTWVSADPRGIQHVSTYRLATVFASRPTQTPVGYSSFALAPGGHDLYALRAPYRFDRRGTSPYPQVLVHIAGVDTGALLRPTNVLDVHEIAPANWDYWPFAGPMNVAQNGDAFLVVGGFDHLPGTAGRERLGHELLFVVHPDGSHQLVLSSEALVRSGLYPPDFMDWRIAASAPNRVWLAVGPYEANHHPQRLFEVIDPNADGDWSDLSVRPIALPASVPFAKQRKRPFSWFHEWQWQLAAEESRPGDDRSRSVLVYAVSRRTNEFRIYRIADRNDDGDALDPGEARIVFARRNVAIGAQIAPRLTVGKSGATREIAVAGLTHPDRISLVSESGRVSEIARSFRGKVHVLTGPRGVLYPITTADALTFPVITVYRLKPAEAGAVGGVGGAPVPTTTATTVTLPTSAAGVPRLAFQLAGAAFTIRADGRGLRRLLADTHVGSFCQSADGRQLAFTSDSEVPTEFFVYVAADGLRPRKVTERHDRLICPFSRKSLLFSGRGPRLVRHDLRSGREIELPADGFVLSPDGANMVYIGGRYHRWNTSGQHALELLDLNTLGRRHLDGPHGTALYGAMAWSPDSRRIAYHTGALGREPWSLVRHRLVLWVRDVSTGKPVLRIPITGGGLPSLSWSADGTRLLVCIEDRGWQPACPAGLEDQGAIDLPHTSGRLLLVDLRDGTVRVVAHGRLKFAGWAPSGDTFAYAIRGKLFLSTSSGTARGLATVPDAQWQRLRLLSQPWLGWSPDARYIGLGIIGHTKTKFAREKGIPVIEVATGKVHVLRPFGRAYYTNVQWWRQPAQ